MLNLSSGLRAEFLITLIRGNKESIGLLLLNKKMAQIQSQQGIDVVSQLFQRHFGSRSIVDKKLTVQ